MIDTSDHETVDTFGPVTKKQKTVKTPGWPEDEAECRNVVYEAAGHTWAVRRISTLGWSVSEYDENGSLVRRTSNTHGEMLDDEESAHQLAREWVEEVVAHEHD